MLVDNPPTTSLFSPEQSTDISEFFHTELFPSLTSSTASSSSRASSPSSSSFVLTTPPTTNLGNAFPPPPEIVNSDPYSFANLNNGLFNFLEDDIKSLTDPFAAPTSSLGFDFMNFAANGGGPTFNFDNATPSSSSGSSTTPPMAIDPQLVGTPSSVSESVDEEEEKAKESDKSAKLTLTINPVKVGGHGKGRKGTVQNGGVTKKTPAPSLSSSVSSAPPASSLLFSTPPPPPLKDNKENKDDDDDDLPADWRPSPEVLAKMTSKEKRQLRNKISARNFRVRRKEYINTLEMDIAERDRLLQAIRTELGSTQSENVALRQEIAALKKALLEGRSDQLTTNDIPVLNLPPPAPLPAVSAAASVAASTSNLVTPNVHKDVPNTAATSPRLNAFWGGNVGLNMGSGGITSVHTVLVPELSALARNVNRPPPSSTSSAPGSLQENINPALNAPPPSSQGSVTSALGKIGGFDGFVDMNPFTMKTLDAYRMQLWTRMAQAHSQSNNNNNNGFSYPSPHSSPSSVSSTLSQSGSHSPPPLISSPSPFTQPLPGNSPLQGLAGGIRPHWFVSSPKTSLSGKHAPSSSPFGLPTPPTSPALGSKKPSPQIASQKDKEQAYMAALASQTLLKKLGGAFWDAFSGSSSVSPTGSSSAGDKALTRGFDSEKVRKVLEGKAVVRVVDLESPTTSPKVPTASPKVVKEDCTSCDCSRLLEEGMRSLTLGRK